MPPRHDDHAQDPSPAPLIYYPAYCYRSSPTWFAWVKVTCFEVHNVLKSGPSHAQTYTSGQTSHPTLFYLNHPIQYVQLIGVVVAIEEYHEHMFLITLDDSSGDTIDIVVRKPRKQLGQNPMVLRDGIVATAKLPDPTASEEQAETLALLSILSTLEISSVVQAKGTVSIAELAKIAARTAFHATVLSKPWVLSRSKQEKLLKLEQGDRSDQSKNDKKRRERKQKLEEREKRHAAVIVKEWVADEQDRERAAEKARRDGARVMQRRLDVVATEDKPRQ
ncbi:uncharacterized protein AB675_12137 [Cyphellophora attinorum]|uniref:CST complex subunit Stn1 N-terminal domain-containing protein n=1 Tax=Cyphellophora attinorum TaxID=1664694 RepID=A0A0N1HRH9_9EURO|nr:uncharacterized protein AB675_12137 [Phialophora attinorum]KPI38403.1 hypothetical protein AB675_12137 [Phialophora attinorum]